MNLRFTAFLSELESLCQRYSITIMTVQSGDSFEIGAFDLAKNEEPDLAVVNLLDQQA